MIGAVISVRPIDVTAHKLVETALTDLSGRLMDAHEQERSWIARELHDDIGQQTVALAMEFRNLAPLIPDGTVGRRSVEEMGFISMEERLKLVNGTVAIESRAAAGTTIRAQVPRPVTKQPSDSLAGLR
jgi:signal transduction histidine kinase